MKRKYSIRLFLLFAIAQLPLCASQSWSRDWSSWRPGLGDWGSHLSSARENLPSLTGTQTATAAAAALAASALAYYYFYGKNLQTEASQRSTTPTPEMAITAYFKKNPVRYTSPHYAPSPLVEESITVDGKTLNIFIERDTPYTAAILTFTVTLTDPTTRVQERYTATYDKAKPSDARWSVIKKQNISTNKV